MALALDVGEYLTEENLRYAVTGAACGVLSDVVRRRLRRLPASLVGVLGPALGLFLAGYWFWPEPSPERLVAVAVVGLAAGHGYERLGAGTYPLLAPSVLLTACGGVWSAVPENGPVVVVAGVVVGLALVRATGAKGLGYGLAASLAWCVELGSLPSGWSFAGGLLCLSPLVAVAVIGGRSRTSRARLAAWPWLVVGSGGIAIVAARWVGVADDATWGRVAIVIVAAAAVVAVAGAGRSRRSGSRTSRRSPRSGAEKP